MPILKSTLAEPILIPIERMKAQILAIKSRKITFDQISLVLSAFTMAYDVLTLSSRTNSKLSNQEF